MKTPVKAPRNPKAVTEGEQWVVIVTYHHTFGIVQQLVESHRTAEQAAKGAAWLNKHSSTVGDTNQYTAIHMDNLEVVA